MQAILLLFLIGILCLGFEVVMPGIVLGIIGGLFMAAGCVVAFVQYGSGTGLLASGAAVLVLGLVLYLEFFVIPHTRLGKKLIVKQVVGATSQPPIGDDALIGVKGEALTTLAPSGLVSVSGQRYEAFSRAGLIEKGASIRVVGRDNFRLIVTPAA